METSRQVLRCRVIQDSDRTAVIDVLTLGFRAQRGRRFWAQAFDRLACHDTPPGYPRFGHLLEDRGKVVGVILQIFTQPEGSAGVRCNMSSWWVMPEYRLYGALLISRALRLTATYTNITPAPATFAILEAQGYRPYCSGRMVTLPWLCRRSEPARVITFSGAMAPGRGLTPADLRLLGDHAGYGCLSVVVEASGERHPFVFAPRRRLGVVGLAVLTYCSPAADFARFAAPLGGYLARRGFPVVVLDADGKIAGLPGKYAPNRPKYYRGPETPRIGDQSYTERALFGS